MSKLFVGAIINPRSFSECELLSPGFVAVDANGKILDMGVDFESWLASNADFAKNAELIQLNETQFLMPGFVDCHIHAPQYAQYGLGLDLPLLEWLNKYTFPLECRFNEKDFAQDVYAKVVHATLNCGTTLAAYFGSNYKDTTVLLAEEALRQGQRAFVGKVCSDCNSPADYVENTAESLAATKAFISDVLQLNSELVQPIITPRFALSCSAELLRGLGELAAAKDLHIQSHISENLQEIEAVKSVFKTSYAEVYDRAGLLTEKTILAHGVHLEDDEIEVLKQRGTAIAHCPASNTMLCSGICDVQRLVSRGLKVGLGTDVSGGNSVSILNVILRALELSRHLGFTKRVTGDQGAQRLTYEQAIYLATLGGAEALGMNHITGNFETNKAFDGLLVDTSVNMHVLRRLSCRERLEKFIYTGDDRNIVRVYINGRLVKLAADTYLMGSH